MNLRRRKVNSTGERNLSSSEVPLIFSGKKQATKGSLKGGNRSSWRGGGRAKRARFPKTCTAKERKSRRTTPLRGAPTKPKKNPYALTIKKGESVPGGRRLLP